MIPMLTATVDWSRALFAMTAMYHWLFVPLTLGLSALIAMMETAWYVTGDPGWRDTTRYWLKLFAVNFAIGVATGIVLEFQFGTNWSTYAWMAGDIFGAPLAIEGLMAFFMESTFFAVMFFGWDRVSRGFHLFSTWMVALGSNLSALWILVANGWMQHPVGMVFNPDSGRNELVDFFAVLFNPNAVAKFLHTVASGYVLGSLFVAGVSAWFILKTGPSLFARRSLLVATSFGFISSIYLIFLGDLSAYVVANDQPAKLAAMEGVYQGDQRKGIIAFGVLNPAKQLGDDVEPFLMKVEFSYLLSIMGFHDVEHFVAGAEDIVWGNPAHGLEPMQARIDSGGTALAALRTYQALGPEGEPTERAAALATFREHEQDMGYGHLTRPEQAIPPIAITFYSFHVMVALGTWFLGLFGVLTYLQMTGDISENPLWLKLAVWSVPLGYLAQETGWIVAEVGRQPWAIQGLLPVSVANTDIDAGTVAVTFFLFAALYTALLVAEVGILRTQIVHKAKELADV